MTLMKRSYHRSFFNSEKHAVGNRGGRHHAKYLARNASLAKKAVTVKNPDDRTLS